MPFDIVTIGLLHTGEEGNPLVYTSRLQEAFPGCNGLSLRRDRWIPVSEHLPDRGGLYANYLLWQEHGDGYGSQVVGYFAGGEFWLYEDGNVTASEAGVTITHWMPLPEPPTT